MPGAKKKPAPVDTVRLKKDIAKDSDIERDNSSVKQERELKVYSTDNKMGKAAQDRKYARIDTLIDVRNKKIPAKKGK